jgi:Bacterial SH3 domain
MGRLAALGLTCALLVTLLRVVASPAVAEESPSTPSMSIDQPVGAPRRATLKISSNLRGSPSMQGEVVATAKQGTPVEIIGETGRWYRVKTEQGLEAWIYKPLVMPEADEQRLPAEPPAASTRPNDTEDLPSPPERPVASADVPLSEGEQPANPALSQPIRSPGALLPTPLPDEGLQFDAIFAFFHATGGYVIAGLVVVVILSIGLQLRAARQLKRAMREMEQIVELVEEIYTASTLLSTASNQTALAPMPSEAVVASLPQPAAELSALERAVLEAIGVRREVQEAELAKILEEQGFPGVLIKAVVGDIVRKTAVEGVPWVEVRYADGRYLYRLRPAEVTMRTGPRQEG